MLLSHQYSHRPDEPLTHAGKKRDGHRLTDLPSPDASRQLYRRINKTVNFRGLNEPRLAVYILIDGAPRLRV